MIFDRCRRSQAASDSRDLSGTFVKLKCPWRINEWSYDNPLAAPVQGRHFDFDCITLSATEGSPSFLQLFSLRNVLLHLQGSKFRRHLVQVTLQTEGHIDGLVQERRNSIYAHWSYVYLALTHRYDLLPVNKSGWQSTIQCHHSIVSEKWGVNNHCIKMCSEKLNS